MWHFTTLPRSWITKKSLFFYTFLIGSYTLCCLKVIFWWFGRIYWGEILIKYQNNSIFTILAPKWWPSTALTWAWIAKKLLFFFTFPIVSYILCCLRLIFWWFGRIYWWKMLIKYQNTYLLTILAPKFDFLLPYPGHELQIIIIIFYFSIVPYTFCCLKVIFWWFGKIYWGKILIKYQNSYILTILAQKYWPSTALPWVWIAKKS